MTVPLTLSDIDLYCAPRSAERGLLIGGTDTGKSTLGELIIERFVRRYPQARVLILDSKPRFRAEWELNGISAKRRYRRWDRGPVMSDSVVLNPDVKGYGLSDVWKMERHIAIMHCEHLGERPAALDAVNAFFNDAHSAHPQLVYVDETLDFFGRTGMPIKGAHADSILRVARAGRERSQSLLAATQRPRGLPLQLVTEATKLYCFNLDYSDDIDHMQDMGLPADAVPPSQMHWFMFYNKRTRKLAYLKLKLDKPGRVA